MELTEEQIAIVEAPDHRRVIVQACPGSGKTTVMVERAKRLIASGRRVVMITFTRSAAEEIESRIGESGLVFCGTVHAFALWLCDRVGSPLGTPISEDDLRVEVEEQLESESRKGMSVAAVLRELNSLYRGSTERLGLITPVRAVAGRVFRSLNYNGLITLDGILIKASGILRTNGDRVGGTFQDLIVDELQDCAPDDWAFFEAVNPKSFCGVGDPNQSLYGFRGGDPSLMMRDDSCTVRMSLTRSFRFGPAIADACNYVSQGFLDSSEIQSDIKPSEVTCLSCDDQASEKARVFEIAKRSIDEGLTVAILCRTNATCDQYGWVLDALGIAEPESRSEISKRDRALLSLVASRFSAASRRCFMRFICGPSFTRAELEASAGCYAWFDRFIKALGHDSPMNYVFAELSHYCREKMRGTDLSIPAKALLATESSVESKDQPRLRIMTIHAAKGREFDVVICPSFVESQIPANRDVREEACCAYVAFSRAKKSLFITHAAQYQSQRRGVVTTASRSRFIPPHVTS